ncbi:MAG: type II toxin-antitoxin system RelE/ParE family toxin [Planctomycetes bacterium]|nr:type II toxin-antitoxin system RelE/ParE family toxin [Planctomycetota bacterium]
MRKLAVEKGVLKELEGLPPKHYRQVVTAIFDLLGNPTPHYSKSLEGSDYRRIAVGEYRVVYRHDEAFVHVLVAGKRNDGDVYKLMQRKL